ncbi:TPA: hypothetical protein N0F65_001838, partial [Lagenidium giganteum]
PSEGSLAAESLPTELSETLSDLILHSKSLGEITRITLAFFHEYEAIQNRQSYSSTVEYPIEVPASEIHNMLVTVDKRALQCPESEEFTMSSTSWKLWPGIGVLSRFRPEDGTGLKGKSSHFLYYGSAAAVATIGSLKKWVADATQEYTQSLRREPTVNELDSTLVKLCEKQGDDEGWPCLTTTTRALLSIIMQGNPSKACALPELSQRLMEAKQMKKRHGSPENCFADVNRRMYDVVSVLASCRLVRIIKLNEESDGFGDPTDKLAAKKHVMFNDAVLNKAGIFSEITLLELRRNVSKVKQRRRQRKTFQRKSQNCFRVSRKETKIPMVTRSRSKHRHRSKCVELPWKSLDTDGQPVELRQSPPLDQTPSLHDLFPAITHEDSIENQVWWQESLQDVGMFDLVATDAFSDWAYVANVAESSLDEPVEAWGESRSLKVEIRIKKDILSDSPICWEDVDIDEIDLECLEDLEDPAINSYFC